MDTETTNTFAALKETPLTDLVGSIKEARASAGLMIIELVRQDNNTVSIQFALNKEDKIGDGELILAMNHIIAELIQRSNEQKRQEADKSAEEEAVLPKETVFPDDTRLPVEDHAIPAE